MDHEPREQKDEGQQSKKQEIAVWIVIGIFLAVLISYMTGRTWCGSKRISIPLPFSYELSFTVPTDSAKGTECKPTVQKP